VAKTLHKKWGIKNLFAWGGGKIQHGAASIRPYALMAWTRDSSILFHPAFLSSTLKESKCYQQADLHNEFSKHKLLVRQAGWYSILIKGMY
jgi:hypothetical protein